MSTIVIADDHEFLRSGLQAVLEGLGHKIVASVDDGDRALAAIAREDPEIVILDIRMPTLDGLAVLQSLRAAGDVRPVILLTAEIDDAKLSAALNAQVDGIVFKSSASAELGTAITRALSGERTIATELMERAIVHAAQPGKRTLLAALSGRELEIAEAVAAGQRNKEIAQAVGMTEGSIKVYLHRIYEKLGVENRTELAVMVLSER